MTTARGGALNPTTSTTTSVPGLPIYPFYCGALSPTLGRWCPLRARDVHALVQVDEFIGQDVYFWGNHMVKYVRLTGVIVAVDEFAGWLVYTLDDSSGVNIEVVCAAPVKMAGAMGDVVDGKGLAEPLQVISPDGPNFTDVDVGSVVKVKGTIRIFREQKQVSLKVITILGDTNAEVKCWNDMIKFRREVLQKPWVVTKEEEERCRLEVDREARWKMEEDEKRKKAKLRKHLREKNRELREKQTEDKERDENSREGRDSRKKRPAKERSRGEGLDPENRVNYPSIAARRRAAGKYDALGI